MGPIVHLQTCNEVPIYVYLQTLSNFINDLITFNYTTQTKFFNFQLQGLPEVTDIYDLHPYTMMSLN